MLLSFLCLSIFADQNNTFSEKQKMQDEVLIHAFEMSQLLQTIDENESITNVAMDTYTNCYIEKMKDLNTTNELKTEKFIYTINSVDHSCFAMVYNKYSITPKVDEMFQKEISEIIRKHLVYSAPARRLGLSGTVKVVFILTKYGSLQALRINKSSNSPLLDNSALRSVQEAASFFPKPSKTVSLNISIQYILQ